MHHAVAGEEHKAMVAIKERKESDAMMQNVCQ